MILLTAQEKYIRKREDLIKYAESFANDAAGKKPRARISGGKKADPDLLRWYEKWNSVFHRRMDELCEQFGITKRGNNATQS